MAGIDGYVTETDNYMEKRMDITIPDNVRLAINKGLIEFVDRMSKQVEITVVTNGLIK